MTSEAPVETLRRIAQAYGTPAYAYDVSRLRRQVVRLRADLPRQIDLLYSLKANPSLGLCGLLADWGLGADVASTGELLIALRAGFAPERIFVNGPHKSPDMLAHSQSIPRAILSIDSLNELQMLASKDLPHRAILRLRPDFHPSAPCAAGPDSRFGIPFEELASCRGVLASRGLVVVGFHVFSGSQMVDAKAVIHHLCSAADLSLRAADELRLTPEILDLGGGFGIPYGPDEQELDLGAIGHELGLIVHRVKPARIVIELGRYIVAQAGWYLTTVVGRQTRQDRQAVVVDGGIHHRSDICGLGVFTRGRSPLVLNGSDAELTATDVLGCLCLPHDALVESSMLPPLSPGNVLAFPNGGAYGLSASPLSFISHPFPAEVAFEGTATELLRARQPVEALLAGQSRIERLGRSRPES
jgi:diaminopimelate decarboxylase